MTLNWTGCSRPNNSRTRSSISGLDYNDMINSAFILGCGRSGTTLVSAILNSHPDVDVPLATGLYSTYGEFVNVPGVTNNIDKRRWEKLVKLLITDVGVKAWRYPPTFSYVTQGVTQRNFGTAVRKMFEYHADRSGKTNWVSKSIHSVLYLERVYKDFPEAKYINCIRDGRDVVLSLLNNNFGPTDIVGAASYWKSHVEAWQNARNFIPGDQLFTVRFDALIRNPEQTIRAILEFMGIPFHSDCMTYYMNQRTREVAIHSEHANIGRPPDGSMIGKYRKAFSQDELILIEAIIRNELTDWNYSPESEQLADFKLPEQSTSLHVWRTLRDTLLTKNKIRRRSFVQRHWRRLRYKISPIR
jgi:Sulfotransferase family